MKKAMLIVGHGSRSKDAQGAFERIVLMVRDICDYDEVAGAHMSLCPPSIQEQVEKLAASGMQEITIVPHFLYEGIHFKEDIPNIILELSKIHNNTRFRLAKPIGDAPELAQILVSRAREADEVKIPHE